MLTKYKAPSLTIPEQIQLLQDKGLNISPENNAGHWLCHVSYYRLKNYTNKFRQAQTGNFVANSTFKQVIDLYLFDRELRFILFDAIETIEVAIKTLISNTMADNHGTHWFMERSHFLPSFEFDTFSALVEKETTDSNEPSIKQYRYQFNDPHLPPCWMVMELLSFGSISRIFEHLSARNIKLNICKGFNLPDNILVNWFHCIAQLRNRCAHHGRIVYRSMTKTITLPSRAKHKFLQEVSQIDLSSLYATLCCIQYLVTRIQPASKFKNSLIGLIDENPHIDYGHMGFTVNWRNEDIWK